MEGRIDYVKLTVVQYRGDVDQSNALMAIFEDFSSEHHCSFRTHVQVRAATTHFFLEIWGDMADRFISVKGEKLIKLAVRCMRLDYRIPFQGEPDLRILGDELSKGTHLNYQTYNSRVRQKTDGRDGGGYGFSVGSMKSTYRLSAYKRGNERPACEAQFRGIRAESLWSEAAHELSMSEPGSTFHTVLSEGLANQYWSMLDKTFSTEQVYLLAELLNDPKERVASKPYPTLQAPLPYRETLFNAIDE
jgi:hypothetical protein